MEADTPDIRKDELLRGTKGWQEPQNLRNVQPRISATDLFSAGAGMEHASAATPKKAKQKSNPKAKSKQRKSKGAKRTRADLCDISCNNQPTNDWNFDSSLLDLEDCGVELIGDIFRSESALVDCAPCIEKSPLQSRKLPRCEKLPAAPISNSDFLDHELCVEDDFCSDDDIDDFSVMDQLIIDYDILALAEASYSSEEISSIEVNTDGNPLGAKKRKTARKKVKSSEEHVTPRLMNTPNAQRELVNKISRDGLMKKPACTNCHAMKIKCPGRVSASGLDGPAKPCAVCLKRGLVGHLSTQFPPSVSQSIIFVHLSLTPVCPPPSLGRSGM
jgi:hypothetical protein